MKTCSKTANKARALQDEFTKSSQREILTGFSQSFRMSLNCTTLLKYAVTHLLCWMRAAH
eukprot:6199759-Pleurochrysis_carterae.AAC.1